MNTYLCWRPGERPDPRDARTAPSPGVAAVWFARALDERLRAALDERHGRWSEAKALNPAVLKISESDDTVDAVGCGGLAALGLPTSERRVHVVRADAPLGTLGRSYRVTARRDFGWPCGVRYRARLALDHDAPPGWLV